MKLNASARLKAAIDIHKALERMENRKHGDGSMTPKTSRFEDSPFEEPIEARTVTAGRDTGCGAGVLFFAQDTGKFLFLQRSNTGDEPGTWCCPGGGVEDYETIDQAVKRETQEEAGFSGDYDLIHMNRDVQPDGFTFHNHMAILPTEFEPQLNDEHVAYVWTDELPEPLHPGLQRSLDAWSQRTQSNSPPAGSPQPEN
jgi:8-oxo-dGTP pyrophosphatase MutT (NUDIX family)